MRERISGGDGKADGEEAPAPVVEARPAPAWKVGPSPPGPGYEVEEISLEELLAVFRRRWKIVVASVALVVAVAAWFTLRQTPVWSASATVRVEDDGSALPTADELMLRRPSGGIETEMLVATTRPILERVVETLSLGFRVVEPRGLSRNLYYAHLDVPRPTEPASYELGREGDGWRLTRLEETGTTTLRRFAPGDTVEIPGGSFVLATDSAVRAAGAPSVDQMLVEVVPFGRAVEALGSVLQVSRPEPQANLLTVSYEGTDRFLVREVPNQVVRSFLERRRRVHTSQARSEAEFLEAENERLELQLDAAEEELQAFREQRHVVAPEPEAAAKVRRHAELRAERAGLAGERDALESLVRALRSGDGRPDYRRLVAFPTFLRNEAVQEVYSDLSETEQRRTEMLSRRTRDHPDVRALTETVRSLEEELGEIGRNYLRSLDKEIASLDAELARFGSELEEVPGREVQYARLQRRTELLTELHTMLQKRLKEAEIAANVEDPRVRVVESAVLPREPVEPRPRLVMALALVLGLLGGSGLAFVREMTDRRIREDEDLDRSLGVPVLTRVPKMKHLDGERGSGGALPLHPNGGGYSVAAESYRKLRTNVRYTASGRGVRQLVVTSPQARDGKSVTAANLAVTFARQGLSTLLVDADLRMSDQHRLFGSLLPTPGLSEVLSGDASAPDVLRTTDTEHLHVLPAGGVVPNPTELLGSERMELLLELTSEEFDAVVVDTPPTQLVTDAAVLAPKVEGVLLVVRADRTDRKAAEETLEQLRRVGANVVGVVLNGASGGGDYGYGYYGTYEEVYGEKPPSKRAWRGAVPFL